MPFAFHYAARSDVGMVRSNNEDSAYAGPELLVLCDGMGGHAAGDVASSLVVGELVHLDGESHGADDMLDIQVFEGAPHFKELHKGMKGKVLCVSGIAFTMAGDLAGPWTCGVLRSRGWGSIRKAV